MDVGVFTCLDTNAHLLEFPKNTTYLEYLILDSRASVDFFPIKLRYRKHIEKLRGRKMRLQLAIEIDRLNLRSFLDDLAKPDSEIRKNVRVIVDALKENGATDTMIRPFSEMNDFNVAIADRGWKIEKGADDSRNSLSNFAKAFTLLRQAFIDAGLDSPEIHFNPLIAKNVGVPADEGNLELTLSALRLIPKGVVQVFGLNLYARPEGAVQVASRFDPFTTPIGTYQTPYVKAETLATRWIERIKAEFPELKFAIGEMGVCNQGLDQAKATWIKETFEWARGSNFTMATYFNCTLYNWAAIPGSLSDRELRQQLGGIAAPLDLAHSLLFTPIR